MSDTANHYPDEDEYPIKYIRIPYDAKKERSRRIIWKINKMVRE